MHTFAHPHRYSPAMQQVLNGLGKARQRQALALHQLPVAAARAHYAAAAQVLELPRLHLPWVQDVYIPNREGAQLPARLYVPSSSEQAPSTGWPCTLFLHGGGFTLGNLETHDALCRQICHQSGAAVLALDYRLAPEHPFPAAIHDAFDTLQHLATKGATFGLDPTRLAVCGDSAGGNLAAVCALLVVENGLGAVLGFDDTDQRRAVAVNLPLGAVPSLRAQALIYPSVAPWPSDAVWSLFANDPILPPELLAYFYQQVAPTSAQRQDWQFAPLLAPDHTGVAPAAIFVAECDPLCEEGLNYADQLRLAGVPVQLEQYLGVAHEFIKMPRALPVARQAVSDVAIFLRDRLYAPAG